MADLKPCPFCGGKIIVILRDTEVTIERYKVVCGDCSAQIYRGTKREVAEAWNRRDGGKENAVD